MKFPAFALLLALIFVQFPQAAGLKPYQPLALDPSPKIQAVVDRAVRLTLTEFAAAKLTSNQIAVTVVDLSSPNYPRSGSYRGAEAIYPASVVKMFYLVAAHQGMEDGLIEDTPELRRAMKDMIVESYNEATHYIVDVLTGTTSGPELPREELDAWLEKRNSVNRYFVSLGYSNINVNRKPWGEGPYGRESQSVQIHTSKRNLLTTDATARLLAEIAAGRAVTKARSEQMLKLMERDPLSKSSDPDDQAHGFTGLALSKGAKLWSKAGWTSQTRHDAALVQLPNGHRLVIVTFTTDHSSERNIIPAVARAVMGELSY